MIRTRRQCRVCQAVEGGFARRQWVEADLCDECAWEQVIELVDETAAALAEDAGLPAVAGDGDSQ